jgi:hypothetical protein
MYIRHKFFHGDFATKFQEFQLMDSFLSSSIHVPSHVSVPVAVSIYLGKILQVYFEYNFLILLTPH